jgi:hypothetical protein
MATAMTTEVVDSSEKALNPFAGGRQMAVAHSGAAESESQRAIAEVQAAIMLAKRFPRNHVEAMDRILSACCRPTLAESAVYSYTRGGQEVTGPSIRLAEAIAQSWGNLQFGIRELAQGGGKSTVEAFAWDVETNTRQVKVFEVPHTRHTKQGTKLLTDPRDIYEMVANQGARRLRACILGVIPGDVVDSALAQCETTLRTNVDVTPEGIQKLLAAFGGIGVTAEQIAQKLGHKVDSLVPAEFVRLRKIFASIRDGYTTAEAEFPRVDGDQPAQRTAGATAAASAAAAAAAKAGGKRSEKREAAPQPAPSPKVSAMEALTAAVEKAATVAELEAIRSKANVHHDDGLFGDSDLEQVKAAIHARLAAMTTPDGEIVEGGAR